ncbi:MAG: hypothetical protein H7066_00650 [Cytophagaceae bacterium]|nr:hypothetical protein [Gemmatimonadaceae bacterium]
MIRRLLATCVVACFVSLGATAAHAQRASSQGTEFTVNGPARSASVAGVRLSDHQAVNVGTVLPPQIKSRGKPISFMVTGAAMFIGGLLIGDDIGTVIAAGGLGLGVYGLYLYSR